MPILICFIYTPATVFFTRGQKLSDDRTLRTCVCVRVGGFNSTCHLSVRRNALVLVFNGSLHRDLTTQNGTERMIKLEMGGP